MEMMSSRTTLPPPHGVKRRADEPVDSEQRLSKRFNLMRLEQNGKHWNPTITTSKSEDPVKVQQGGSVTSESMQLDDTKNRVFIRDLDEELATIGEQEREEELIFLPDIERKLNKVPTHILRGQAPTEQNLGTELVLYTVPTSLSVPIEKDSVRKAIIESRARAREQQQQQPSRDAMLHDDTGDHNYAAIDWPRRSGDSMAQAEDAMEIG